LNGEQVIARDVPRIAAPNQDEVDLQLRAGENCLLLKIYNRTGGHAFFYQLEESPLQILCDKIAADFPREDGWFKQDAPEKSVAAWLLAEDGSGFERQILASAVKHLPDANALVAEIAALADAPPGDPCRLELFTRIRKCAVAADRLDTIDLVAMARAIDDLAEAHPKYEAARFRSILKETEASLPTLREALSQGNLETVQAVDTLMTRMREPLLANPLLDFEEILLVKRREDLLGLPQNWQGNCAIPSGGYENIIASMKLANGELSTLYAPENSAFVGDVDLHFGADRMLFSMPGSHGRWQIWEMRADGSGLRQVTPGEHRDVDNYDACYLPDGRIVFASTRAFQGVPCVGGGNTVANLCLLDPATNNIRQLCFDQDHNWCPTVMNDGRVMYTRWEYSDTPHYFSRIVFRMNPDGTGQSELYGSNSFWPNSVFYARPIPDDPTKFVAIVSGHHGVPRMGELVIFDPAKGRFESDGVVQRIPGYGKKVEPIIVDQLVDASWPKFLHPYPLSEKYFLVSCKPSPSAPWGIYLADIFDNITLLKEVPGYSLFEPIPLRTKALPPLVPDKARPEEDEATVYVANIYRGPGLRGVPRGKVKALRVYEFHYAYPQMGGHINVAVEGGWDVHRILGTVPVHEDGSALFKVPANIPIAVQPLDKDRRALQLMRSWFSAMPGEALSCVGCHERQNETAPPMGTLASQQAPAEITPWLGPARGLSFKRDVQPVLNKYCVGCHNDPEASQPDFSPSEENGWQNFTPSYLALHPYVRRPGPESDYHVLEPLEYYADTSELVQMLEKGHHGVELDDEAWDRINTWIDLNVPDHGTWAEHRPIPNDYHERRIEMRTRYAGRSEDPEAIPELPPMDDTFVSPEPAPSVDTVVPASEAWPMAPEQVTQLQSAAGNTRRTLDLGDGATLEMVLVPAGEFVMGDPHGYPDEQPLALVKLEEPYWMGVTEVTQAQYARFDPTHDEGFIDQQNKDHTLPGYSIDEPDFPVIRVSWQEATAYCDWLSAETGLSFTLPTEAQWEWACRAGSASPMHYGALDGDFSTFANLADASMSKLAVSGVNPQPIPNASKYEDFLPKEARFDDGQKILCAVGQYEPNAWGLMDMHGNTAEWTLSAYRSYPYAADGRNERKGDEERVVRGGSWRDRPKHARSAFRLAYEPWRRVYNVGFRVICTVEDAVPQRVAAHEDASN
jgi:formylglycine-generating enzyme required for sulfatase activity